MYFFIFKSNGKVKHVIQAGTRDDAFVRLNSLLGRKNEAWDFIGAEISIIHCDYKNNDTESEGEGA